MKLAVSTGFCHTLPHNEALQIIAASGCNNIELLVNQAFHSLPDDEIIAAIHANSLNVSSIHAFPQVWLENIPDDESESISRALGKLGSALNNKLVVSHSIVTRSNGICYNNDTNHKRAIRHFNEIQPLPVTTENMPPGKMTANTFLTNPDKTYQFLQSGKLPLTFDTTHYGFFSHDLIGFYERFKPYIRNIHISDFCDGKEHLIPGTGTLPLKQFVQHLKIEGYDGSLTIELDFVRPDGLYLAGQDKIAAALRQAVEYVGELL